MFFPNTQEIKYWEQSYASRTNLRGRHHSANSYFMEINCTFAVDAFLSVGCQKMVVRSLLQPSLWLNRAVWLLELCLDRQVCKSVVLDLLWSISNSPNYFLSWAIWVPGVVAAVPKKRWNYLLTVLRDSPCSGILSDVLVIVSHWIFVLD